MPRLRNSSKSNLFENGTSFGNTGSLNNYNGSSVRKRRKASHDKNRDVSVYFEPNSSGSNPDSDLVITRINCGVNEQSPSRKLAKLKKEETSQASLPRRSRSSQKKNAFTDEKQEVDEPMHSHAHTCDANGASAAKRQFKSQNKQPALAACTVFDRLASSATTQKFEENTSPHQSHEEQASLGEQETAVKSDSRTAKSIRQRKKRKTQTPMKSEDIESDGTVCSVIIETHKSSKGKTAAVKKRSKQPQKVAKAFTLVSNEKLDSDASDSDDANTWEEVEELIGEEQLIKLQLPDKPVEIFLDGPDIPGNGKRKRKPFDVQAYLRRKWKKFKKDMHESLHKVHLLCFLSYGNQLNEICCSEVLRALGISLFHVDGAITSGLSQTSLGRLLQRFNREISLSLTEPGLTPCLSLAHLEDELIADFAGRVAHSKYHLALMFLLLLRAYGVKARVVLSIHPVPWRLSDSKKLQKSTSPHAKQSSTKHTALSQGHKHAAGGVASTAGVSAVAGKESSSVSSKKIPKAAPVKKPCAKNYDVMAAMSKGSSRRRSCTIVKSYDEKEGADDDKGEVKQEARDTLPAGPKKRLSATTSTDKDEEDSDDDFDLPATSRVGLSTKSTSARKSLEPTTDALELWLEVCTNRPEKWLSLDVADEVIDRSDRIESEASMPVTYVIAFDNEGSVKDVTQRYASGWMSGTQKLRVDKEWWEETLAPYHTVDEAGDRDEDAQLQSFLEKRPFPTSVSEFKGHPLYALKRHLLKFQALYPETAVPLGYIKGEPIYARECVHTLHSRETWLKEAKSVRIGEKPYKMVKPRPKMNKPNENKDQPTLGVYGYWQVEDFQPPVATEGKVPRNDYGNVELFKPCMLPIGCVHLPIPSLHRIAKKLNIDCAPAMIGWEGYCGYSVPQFDGWIVCEEFKDTLLIAWEEFEAEERRKQAEKREKRVLDHWKLLVRGLLIKEKLKRRFDQSGSAQPSAEEGVEKALDVEKAWPQNKKKGRARKAGSEGADNDQLFPFEKM